MRRFGVFIVNFKHISQLCSSVSIVNFEHVIAGWVSFFIENIYTFTHETYVINIIFIVLMVRWFQGK